MSERTNTEVVQQGYEAFGRGDIPALLQFLTVDVEWTQQGPSVVPFSGTRHGHEGELMLQPLALILTVTFLTLICMVTFCRRLLS